MNNQNKDTVIAVENYGANKKIFTGDIVEISELLDLLYKLDNQEVSLTRNGLDYLNKKYSLDSIVKMILDEIDRGIDYKYKDKDRIKEWLINEARD